MEWVIIEFGCDGQWSWGVSIPSCRSRVIRLVVARSLGSHSKSEPEEQAVLHGSNLRESGAHDTALWRDGSGGSSQS